MAFLVLLLITMVGLGWLWAFDRAEIKLYGEDVKEEGSEEQITRIQIGKRLRRVCELLKDRADAVVRGLVGLMTAKPVDRYVGLHLRDTGAQWGVGLEAAGGGGGEGLAA